MEFIIAILMFIRDISQQQTVWVVFNMQQMMGFSETYAISTISPKPGCKQIMSSKTIYFVLQKSTNTY